jgi:uncharacterized protein YbjT (DUF2867 family)
MIVLVIGGTGYIGTHAVEELLRRGLLRESSGRYFFIHDKIREVTYAAASPTRQRVLHRRALEVLEAAAAPPATLARHALAAELREMAFRYSLAAGDHALRLFAVRNAIAHYERARELLSVVRGPPSVATAHCNFSNGQRTTDNGPKCN